MVRCCGMGCRVWRGSGFWCRVSGWNGRMWGGWGRGGSGFWDSELGLVGFGGGFLGFRVSCWGPRLMVLALYGLKG